MKLTTISALVHLTDSMNINQIPTNYMLLQLEEDSNIITTDEPSL